MLNGDVNMTAINVPQVVYKFMNPHYLKCLKQNKTIYINFLKNYKEIEYGKEIGDDLEGILHNNINITNYTFGDTEINKNCALEKLLEDERLIKCDGGGKVVLDNCAFHSNHSENNYYVYCICKEYDGKVKEEFGGATLIISNYAMFLTHLQNALIKKNIHLVTVGECVYIADRTNHFNEKGEKYDYSFPALVKEKRYEYQKEFRVLWARNDGEIITEPIEIYCPEALEYCSFQY